MILTSKRKRNCQQWTLKRKKLISTNLPPTRQNMLLIWKLSEEVMPYSARVVEAGAASTVMHPVRTDPNIRWERDGEEPAVLHISTSVFSVVDFCKTASVILPYRAVLLQIRRGWASCLILDEPHVGERGRWKERCCFCCPDFYYLFILFYFFNDIEIQPWIRPSGP